jgi:hypothetical protein
MELRERESASRRERRAALPADVRPGARENRVIYIRTWPAVPQIPAVCEMHMHGEKDIQRYRTVNTSKCFFFLLDPMLASSSRCLCWLYARLANTQSRSFWCGFAFGSFFRVYSLVFSLCFLVFARWVHGCEAGCCDGMRRGVLVACFCCAPPFSSRFFTHRTLVLVCGKIEQCP